VEDAGERVRGDAGVGESAEECEAGEGGDEASVSAASDAVRHSAVELVSVDLRDLSDLVSSASAPSRGVLGVRTRFMVAEVVLG
jgi:hypothetical protein